MKKVIVIDDESIQRHGLISSVPWQLCGCEVIGEADNVEDALQLIRTTAPQIIVTDICMPGMTGLEMIHLLQAEIECEFIIISGYSEFAYAKEALSLGVVSYLLKPIGDDELIEALESAVSRIDKRERLRTIEEERSAMDGEKTISQDILENYGCKKTKDVMMQTALEYIRNNCHKNLTVQQVSDYLHISTSYFWKRFSSQMPCTFNDYLTECRIRKAIQLLGDHEMRIYEIAAQCGYKDHRYFSNVFRKLVGVTPTEYRNGSAQTSV